MKARKAPFVDFDGNDIFEGDVIRHPSGERGVVIYFADIYESSDAWLIDYKDNGKLSRLCLQVGSKGRAVVEKRSAAQTPSQL